MDGRHDRLGLLHPVSLVDGVNDLVPGSIVVVRAFDDVPEHLFRVEEVHEDCVTGIAITGPLAGQYGESTLKLIVVPA